MTFLPANPYCNTNPVLNTPLCSDCDPCAKPVCSDSVKYNGPGMSCSDIDSCDSLTVALQKLNQQVCDIWEVVNTLTTTTTSTSTSSSTTTSTTSTTTTAIPSYEFLMKVSTVSSTDACSNGILGTYYSNTPTLDGINAYLTIDPQLQQAASNGYYCLAQGCPNPSGKAWVRLNSGNGVINQAAFC